MRYVALALLLSILITAAVLVAVLFGGFVLMLIISFLEVL